MTTPDIPTRRRPLAAGRLAGKVALVTGAGGNIGAAIVRRYLEEGAHVVLVGRDRGRLEATLARVTQALGPSAGEALIMPFDAADPAQARHAIETVMQKFGRLDVLVNNAGSTGPKQSLGNLPQTPEDLRALRVAGANDTETVRAAIANLFGLTWHMCRAAAPHLRPGASIVNVSTIFSRTHYYGRAAYVVPKAALNTFSRHLARQLGPRGIRVNVVYPGPIDSERIHAVFAAMDGLRKVAAGTTTRDVLGTMALSHASGDGAPQTAFPSLDDVASSIVFLGADESRAFSAHGFEVTNGMDVRQESRSTPMSWPQLCTLDGSGTTVLVAAGEQLADALTIAGVQADVGAHVLLGLQSADGVAAARAALARDSSQRRAGHIEPLLLERGPLGDLHSLWSSARVHSATPHGRLHGAVILPAYGATRFRGGLVEISDADVEHFLSSEIAGAVSVARELTRFWKDTALQADLPRAVFLSNGDDGQGNIYADILRAAIEALIRIWRDESEMQVQAGDRSAAEWANQILRWSSAEAEALPFAAAQAARLLFMKRRIPQICLYA